MCWLLFLKPKQLRRAFSETFPASKRTRFIPLHSEAQRVDESEIVVKKMEEISTFLLKAGTTYKVTDLKDECHISLRVLISL